MTRILCFGDSNTYGYKPDGTGRFGRDSRWTGILSGKLGNGYDILEEDLCGRTTVFQDEFRDGRIRKACLGKRDSGRNVGVDYL